MKKNIFPILILLTYFSSFAQNENHFIINQNEEGLYQYQFTNVVTESIPYNKAIVWTAPELISENINEDSRDMGIAMGKDSIIHVVYVDDVPGYPSISRQRITYRSRSVSGVWSNPIIIDEFDGVTPRNNHEASIEVSDNGDVHVVFHYWAYDGTGRNQIGYSKYTKATDTWSTEIISGPVGTVYATYADYPRVSSTSNNIPVVTWGNDERNGTDRDEAFLTYNDGTWHTPIEISSTDSTQAQFPRITTIENEKVFIVFREKNYAKDTFALYFRTFDIVTGALSPIQKIVESERPTTYLYYNYDVTYLGNDSVFIALNLKDTIVSYTYDVISDSYSVNSQIHRTNLTNNYLNYHLLSIDSDDSKTVHFAYDVWNLNPNTPSQYYMTFDYSSGFSTPELFSPEHAIDEPQIIYGTDGKLHIIACDDHEDTNNDGYVDREVYYITEADLSGLTEIEESTIIVYPNPSSNGIFHLKNSHLIKKITVHSMDGKEILINKQNKSIDLTEFKKGVYVLKIETNTSVKTIRIIY